MRESRWRESQQRMFDVQMMGGIVLHEGDIAEMKTGEGKTFVASTALYLNALADTGVHLVTVNDYLAKRDAEWNRPVFERLGMTVGFIQNMMPFAERKEAYEADITYGTNSEFGFDYLRDNMAVSKEGLVQRSHAFAIVDEVDSILIDEARTPLIISGEPETAATTYYDFARIAKGLTGAPATRKTEKGEDETELSGADYLYDEKHKTISPAQTAIDAVERALAIENLYDPRNVQLVNHLTQALKAQSLYQRDVDYVIQDGEVKIVDEYTGRIMEGRRWSEGLHQAIEAKEGVRIQEENVTLATITLQNYFRLYEKLAGMTGTAKTEEKEFVEIYDLHVVEIPTNVPVTRQDENDFIFKTKEAKFAAVIDDIAERHEKGQPVLVGTIAVETSEYLSELMTRRGIPHNVLNAKEHERESEIIKDAGQPGLVTIATNMAGRGVDIKLGEGVVDARRPLRARDRAARVAPDRQPAARPLGPSGRPGRDALLPLGAGRPRAPLRRRPDPRDHGALQAPGRPADGGGDPLAPDRGRAEEGRGAELRLAQERPQVRRRDEHAAHGDLRAAPPRARRGGSLGGREGVDPGGRDDERREPHRDRLRRGMGSRPAWSSRCTASTAPTSPIEELREEVELDREALIEEFVEDALETYAEKEEELGTELMREVERYVILQVVDSRWREHLDSMDYLRDGIHLRAMAQKDPLVEYRGEGHKMFEELSVVIREEVVLTLFHAQVEVQQPPDLQPQAQPQGALAYQHETASGADAIAAAGAGAGVATALASPPRRSNGAQTQGTVVNDETKEVGRNDPCWCGSGKKFKKCHGA